MARQQAVLTPLGGGQWSVSNERAKDENEKQKKWQDMLQTAAMATKMNDMTALGYGLGTLLFNNWDKWFGNKGKGQTAGDNSRGTNPYDFSQNMAMAQDPMQMAAASGNPNAQWALEHNQPFNLMAVQQNPAPITAAPMPDNLTVNGINPQTATTGNAIQAGVPLTQQFTVNGQNAEVVDPAKTIMDSNLNPANSSNLFTSAMNNPPNSVGDVQNNALGGFGVFGANNYNASPLSGAADAIKEFSFEDWLKNLGQ